MPSIHRHSLGLSLSVFIAGASSGQFLEPGSAALQTLSGTGGFGWAASELADITGDGVMEAMISAPSAFGGYIDVYDGATGALLNRFRGVDHGITSFGWSLADAGDVDGDTVTDIVGGANSSGVVLIFSGADYSLIHRVDQLAPSEGLGYAVAGVGDLNGDGFGEVIAGAPLYDITGANNIGRVYVINGADGTVLDTVDGLDALDQFGSAAAGIGDVTGDGIGDFAVGAHNAGPTADGAAYIFDGATRTLLFPGIEAPSTGNAMGQFFVGPAGDANNDGTPDVYAGDYSDVSLGGGTGRCYVISGATGELLWTRPGTGPGQGFGCGRGAGGDVNFDGYDDLIVGCYTANQGGSGAGRALVLSGLDGSILRTITNTTNGQQFGFDAVGIGDVSGDGLIDFLVAAGGGNAGYIVRGELICPADINLDGMATPADFSAWVAAFNAGDHKADQNRDEMITPADFSAWVANYNSGC